MIQMKQGSGVSVPRPGLAQSRDYRWLRVGAAVEVEGDARVALVHEIHHTRKSGEGVALVVDYGGEGHRDDCDQVPLDAVSSAWPAWCVTGAKVWVQRRATRLRELASVIHTRLEVDDDGVGLDVAVWYEGTTVGEVVPLVLVSPAAPDYEEVV